MDRWPLARHQSIPPASPSFPPPCSRATRPYARMELCLEARLPKVCCRRTAAAVYQPPEKPANGQNRVRRPSFADRLRVHRVGKLLGATADLCDTLWIPRTTPEDRGTLRT